MIRPVPRPHFAALDGALNSAMIFGGETPRSMTVTVSSTGFAGTETVPSLRTTLPSFEDTAICAAALIENSGKAAVVIATASACVSQMRSVMTIPPGSGFSLMPYSPTSEFICRV